MGSTCWTEQSEAIVEFAKIMMGKENEKEVVRDEFGRIVAVVSYISNRTSTILERMVFRGRGFFEKNTSAGYKSPSYWKYGDQFYLGKTDYRHSC